MSTIEALKTLRTELVERRLSEAYMASTHNDERLAKLAAIHTVIAMLEEVLSNTREPSVRIYHRQPDGKIIDAVHDVSLSDFAGSLPNVGDWILEPGVPTNLDRSDPKNRNFWVVIQRVFNPRDNEDYVALVVEDRKPTPAEYDLV
jgi:hypothetical protein